MSVRVEEKDNEVVVYMEGHITSVNADEFAGKINEYIDNVGMITVDMGAVDYLTSAGMRVLLKAHMDIKDHGKLRLVNVSDKIMYVLTIAKFDKLIEINGEKLGTFNESGSEIPNADDMYFERYILNDEEQNILPIPILSLVAADEAKAFALTDEDGETAAFAVIKIDVEKSIAFVMYIHENNPGQDHWQMAMLLNKLRYYCRTHDLETIRLCLINEPSRQVKEKAAASLGYSVSGASGAFIKYSMKTIRNSPIVKKLGQLDQFLSQVKMLNELSEADMWEMQVSFGVNTASIDPLFSRFFVKKGQVAGLLSASEYAENKVVIGKMMVSDEKEIERNLTLMLASFLNILINALEDEAELHVLCDDGKQAKVCLNTLGKPEEISEYKVYEYDIM